MFSKIAINNVKKSIKDYSIYFLTLTFAVCIFYSFNSLAAQKSVLELNKSTENYMVILNKLIAGISVFVSFILGGLIIYANNFLIKKRKKELGIYMTLGMAKSKISKILILETFLIGLLSLAAGILLGIIVSQGLSIITAKLLAVNINKFKFIISPSAIIKSVLYFGIIFLLVMIFNQVIISKYRLIDMLNAAKKNEDIKVENPVISVLIFLLSAALLTVAYSLVLKVGLNPKDIKFTISIILGVVGTLLLFFSLSSFFLYIIQKNKKIYLKNLNIFVLRQINNKITTNFISMSVICLMLFLTITLLFTMFGYKSNIDKLIKGNSTFDASAKLDIDSDDQKVKDIKGYLDKMNFKFNAYEKHTFYNEYKLNIQPGDLFKNYLDRHEQKDSEKYFLEIPISAVKISQYNSIRKLSGQQIINLKDNQVLVVSNYEDINNALGKFINNHNSININGKAYNIKNETPIKTNLVTTGSDLNFFYLIIPDNFSGKLKLYSTGFDVMFSKNNKEKSEEKFKNLFKSFINNRYKDGYYIPISGNTIEQVHALVYGSSTIIVFIGIYLGIVFLISSAAVLALQQLSEASDSLDRYNSLKKIGAPKKLIDKSILTQNLIYFMAPLTLAIIHSTVSISIANRVFSMYNQSSLGSSYFMIASALIIIYGGYFYATYMGFKNVVKSSN